MVERGIARCFARCGLICPDDLIGQGVALGVYQNLVAVALSPRLNGYIGITDYGQLLQLSVSHQRSFFCFRISSTCSTHSATILSFSEALPLAPPGDTAWAAASFT